MKVYIDIVFFTNFLFDFILLLSVKIILKRNMKIYRIILGALTGTLTLLMLFIRMNSLTLFLYKLVISIIMVLITTYVTKKFAGFSSRYFLAQQKDLGRVNGFIEEMKKKRKAAEEI